MTQYNNWLICDINMHGFFFSLLLQESVQPDVYNMLILICNGCVYMQIKLDRIYTKQGKQNAEPRAVSPETLIKVEESISVAHLLGGGFMGHGNSPHLSLESQESLTLCAPPL